MASHAHRHDHAGVASHRHPHGGDGRGIARPQLVAQSAAAGGAPQSLIGAGSMLALGAAARLAALIPVLLALWALIFWARG